jgi:hypothetical protein
LPDFFGFRQESEAFVDVERFERWFLTKNTKLKKKLSLADLTGGFRGV